MDAATQRQWEAWANALIQSKLESFAEILGQEVGLLEKRFNVELERLDDRVAALEAEIEILRRHNARNVTPLRPAACRLTAQRSKSSTLSA